MANNSGMSLIPRVKNLSFSGAKIERFVPKTIYPLFFEKKYFSKGKDTPNGRSESEALFSINFVK